MDISTILRKEFYGHLVRLTDIYVVSPAEKQGRVFRQ